MTVLVTKTNLMTRKSRAIGMQYKGITLKPWQGDNLGLLATPFGQGLRVLALTCADLRLSFGRVQICTEVDASVSPFGHPTQVNAS